MGHYRFYELDPSDHITAGFSVECGSDAAAMRAARTLLERSAGVEVWKSCHCIAHLHDGAAAQPEGDCNDQPSISTIRRTGRLLAPSMPVSSSTFPALPCRRRRDASAR